VDSTGNTWEILTSEQWQSDSSAAVTCVSPSSTCCSTLTLSSTGGIADNFPEMLGSYQEDPENSGEFPAYIKGNSHLYLLKDIGHHFEGWTISDTLTDVGKVANVDLAKCAEKADSNGWEFLTESGWLPDESFKVECDE